MYEHSITTWAEQILALIDADIADGVLPADVASYTDLHDHIDANHYLDDVGVPAGTSVPVNNIVAAVQNEVTRLLRDADRPRCGGATCTWPGHHHTRTLDAHPPATSTEDRPAVD